MPTYSLIAAMTNERVIGKDNQLPWQMPADMAYFKKTTLNKIIVMGRKTFDSMGRALPNRRNIVITRDKHFSAKDVEIFHSVQEVITAFSNLPESTEIFVIGGSEIFKQFLPIAHKIYLTFIDASISGDTFFPEWDPALWKEISRETHQKDAENGHDYHFVVMEKVSDI